MGFVLSKQVFNELLADWGSKYRIYAPTLIKNGGIFSDTDCIRYGEVSSVEEIVFAEKSQYSFRKNPRLGQDFIKWVDEASILQIILNTYSYVEAYIDQEAPNRKEHIGYIVDRTGFEEFKKWAMRDVKLPSTAEVFAPLYWQGIKYGV